MIQSLLSDMSSNDSSFQPLPTPSPIGYTIYSKSGCVYCERVKELLQYEKTTVVDCDAYLLNDRDWFLQTMRAHCGRDYQMFPMVFYNGTFLGGFDDTKEFYQTKLVEMLEDF